MPDTNWIIPAIQCNLVRIKWVDNIFNWLVGLLYNSFSQLYLAVQHLSHTGIPRHR